MYTYQDFLRIGGTNADIERFARAVLEEYIASDWYRTMLDADEYDAERNTGITRFMRFITGANGKKVQDTFGSNIKITSNFFRRLNVQRNTYSLGNGVTFQAEGVQEKLGARFDTELSKAGYFALIHGVSYLFWTGTGAKMLRAGGKGEGFAPLWDEDTGALGAGIRFWQISRTKPLRAVFYTPDGTMELVGRDGSVRSLEVAGEMQAYRQIVERTAATGEERATAHNYGRLPIVPVYGSSLKQSTLVGMRTKIDAYDLIKSGFANDLADCAEIYWVISGAGGMTEKDIAAFRERILYRHVASVPGADEGIQITPHTQEVPYAARKAALDDLRVQIYEDFGALDVHTVSAGSTNDHIDAAYQPMDENADDYEYQIIEAVQELGRIIGIDARDATPQFKRNRISNQKEQVEMLMLEAPYIDEETLLKKLPNISSEEVAEILQRKSAEEYADLKGDEEDEEA